MAELSHMPRTRWLDALIILLTLATLAFVIQMLWGLLSQFSDIILLFALAIPVASALGPLIDRLDEKPLPSGVIMLAKRRFGDKIAKGVEHFRLSRLLAVVVTYIALALILVGVIAVLVPPATQQLSQLIDQYAEFANNGSSLASRPLQWLARIGVRSSDINSALTGALGSIQNLATLALQNAFVFLQGAVNLAGNLSLVLFFSFFFTLDGPRLLGKAFELVPPKYHDDAQMLAVTVDRVFGEYIRLTLLEAGLIGAGTAIVLVIFGQPHVLVASLFAGLFMLIPFVGDLLALVPPVLITVPYDPAEAVLIFVILLIYQLVVVNLVIPRLQSDALGLHPVIIMVSLLIGLRIGGFWGAIFAVPIAGVLATVALYFYRRAVPSKPAVEEQVAVEQAAGPSGVTSLA